MANGYDFADAMPDVGYDATVDRVEAGVSEKTPRIVEDDPEAIANLNQRLAELKEEETARWEGQAYDYAGPQIDVTDKTFGEKLADILNLGKTVVADADASTTPTGVQNQKAYDKTISITEDQNKNAYDETISIWDRIKDIDMSDIYGYPVDVVTEILNMALPQAWEIDRPIGGSQQLSEDATKLVETVKELDDKLAGNIDLVSKVIGYPVDVVTTILNVALPKDWEIDKPVGGSKWYAGLFEDEEGEGVTTTDVAPTTVPGEEIVVEKTTTGETENKYIQNFITQQKDILETATKLEKDWEQKYKAAKKSTGSSIKAHLNKEVQKAAKLMNAYRNTDEYIRAYGIVNPSFLGKLSEKLPVVAFAKRAEDYLRARNMYTKITGEELLNFVKQGIKEGVPYHLRHRGDPPRDRDIMAFKSMYPAASSLSDEEILYLMNNPEALRTWLETIENADQEG